MTLPVALPCTAKRRASPRRALRVSGCSSCTRRDLITGLVTSATSAKSQDASAELSSKARAAYDASFARTMETGMADYELHMTMVKRELFRDLAGKDVLEIGMNTGPNLRYMRDARSVIGVEPNAESFPYARANAERFGVRDLVLKKGVGERLPGIPDASLDFVVSTLVICVSSDAVSFSDRIGAAAAARGDDCCCCWSTAACDTCERHCFLGAELHS